VGRKREKESHIEDLGLGSMFRSLGGFLDLLSNLTEQSDQDGGGVSRPGEISRSGEIGNEKKGVKAVYGFSVKLGGGGKPHIEQFGNVRERERGAVVEETREPMVDVFDEGDCILLIAELPGVEAGDVGFEVNDDVLSLTAVRGERKYRKEVLLPAAVKHEGAVISFHNGVLELKLSKVK